MGIQSRVACLVGVVALAGGCESKDEVPPRAPRAAPSAVTPAEELPLETDPEPIKPTVHATRDAYFGNLHVHTAYSFDAFANGAVATPDDAYRWAKGASIPAGSLGGKLRIKRPLDWYAVSDHAEYMGLFSKLRDPNNPANQLPIAKEITSEDQAVAFKAYARVLDGISTGKADPDLASAGMAETIWQEVVKTADDHYKPGQFTTFPAFEWTSQPGGLNLHRVVLFETSNGVPERPISAFDSDDPTELWKWMDRAREGGAKLFAVPHNGNASNGLMFPVARDKRVKVDAAYAEMRRRNEPLYEISQIAGSSETHPVLAPSDEFAGFELWDYLLSSTKVVVPKRKKGSYARQALLDGLSYAAEGAGNPYHFGFIGDSDTHNAASTIEEDNFSGKFGMESRAKSRYDGPIPGDGANNERALKFSSGGLAGIWAESNTREALFAAMQRKETFATSGTRLKLRFFASWRAEAPRAFADEGWLKKAYADGVPMGGDLAPGPEGKAPTFLVHAMKDPDGAHLDRVQIIKGWLDKGKQRQQVYEVAASGDREPDKQGKLEPVGNTVNVKLATYANKIGAPELSAAWTDPDFDPKQHAFYYARVIEIPTPRWSTYDASTLGRPPLEAVPETIQERGWSSPIWVGPE